MSQTTTTRNNTPFIVSNLDVINNKHITRGTQCILFDDKNRRFKAVFLVIEKYDKLYNAPDPEDVSKVWGNCKVSYAYVKDNERTTATETFIVHRDSNGIGKLVGTHSLALVPQSDDAVHAREARFGDVEFEDAEFDVYHVQNGLDLHTKQRISGYVKKIEKHQDDIVENKITVTKKQHQLLNKYARRLNKYLLKGIRNEDKLSTIHTFLGSFARELTRNDENKEKQNDSNSDFNSDSDSNANADSKTKEEKKKKEKKKKKRKKVEGRYKCPFCNWSNNSKSYLRKNHIYILHQADIVNWIQCDLCQEKFENVKDVKNHKKQGRHKKRRIQIDVLCPKCAKGTLFKAVEINGVFKKAFCSNDTCTYNTKYIGDSATYTYNQ